jgi:hypothetical protein
MKVEEKADEIWKHQRFNLISEYVGKYSSVKVLNFDQVNF